MNVRILVLLTILFAQSTCAQITPSARRDSIIAFYTANETGNNHAAAVAHGLANDTAESRWDMLRLLTDQATPDAIERFHLTTAYILLRDRLPADLKSDIEVVWSTLPVRPLETEHERVAYYTALYLTTVAFPPEAAWFNGKSREENERDSRAFLLHWFVQTTEDGQEEFDSPIYGSVMFYAMLLIRDHATDEGLRKRGDLMAQWLLADFAHDYLARAYAGAHAREHLFSAMKPITSDMSALAWLYFGDGPQVYSRDQYFAALSDFEALPEIIDLATVRTEHYEAWEQKQAAPVIRDNGLAKRGTLWKYTYMDPLYAIGSIPGGLIQPREQHTWDVTWIPEDLQHPATLFLMQPYSDAASLTPFMPHSEELALRTTGMLDSYHGTVTKIVGGSPFEDVFQYRNTLIALYDIGAISRFPVIAGFLPPNPVQMDIDSAKSGWITLNTGDVYIGLLPFKRFRIADGTYGKGFISYDKRNGAILQVVGRDVAGSYEQFVKRIKATKADLSSFDSDTRISYITMFGDTLSMAFGGEKLVNGAPFLPPSGDVLFSSPRLHSFKGSGILTIRGKAGETAIDMKKLEIRRTQ